MQQVLRFLIRLDRRLTSDPGERRFKHKMQIINPFLGLILHGIDQKCTIYVIFMK